MANVFPDPFIRKPSLWTLDNYAFINDDYGALAPPSALVTEASGSGGYSAAAVIDVPLTVGLSYPAPVVVLNKQQHAVGDLATMEMDPGSGGFSVFKVVDPSTLTLGEWTSIAFDSGFVAVGAVGRLRLQSYKKPSPPYNPGPTILLWDVIEVEDNIPEVATMAYRKWLVVDRLRQKVLNIRGPGSGYWNDIGDRVFFSLILPEDTDGVVEKGDSYVCLPFDGQAQTPAQVEGRHMLLRWRQRIIAYVFNPDQSLADKSGRLTRMVADMEDDLHRALFAEPSMNKLVHDSRIVDSMTFAGEDPEQSHGEAHMMLEFDAYVDANDLGPTL